MQLFMSPTYRTMPEAKPTSSGMLPDFDAHDEQVASKITKVYKHSRFMAGVGAATLILLHELCSFVPLPATGGMVGEEIGIAPLLMSSLFRSLFLTEFGIRKERVPPTLCFQLALVAFYIGQWSSRALGSWSAHAVALDAFVLLSFATAVRYLDIVVSNLSNKWISLVHASICISHGTSLLTRLTMFPDGVVVAGSLALCYFLVTRGGDSAQFRSIKHRNQGSMYDIPFMYNGSTAIIYADTMLPMFAGIATLVASSTTILQGAWVSTFLSAIPGEFASLGEFMGSAMGMLMQLAIVATLELRLPRMQGRDARGVIRRYEEQHMTLQGWRAKSDMAKSVLARKIWSTQRKALGVTLATKLMGVSGTLIVVEQLHSIPIRAAFRKLPRGLRAPFAIAGWLGGG